MQDSVPPNPRDSLFLIAGDFLDCCMEIVHTSGHVQPADKMGRPKSKQLLPHFEFTRVSHPYVANVLLNFGDSEYEPVCGTTACFIEPFASCCHTNEAYAEVWLSWNMPSLGTKFSKESHTTRLLCMFPILQLQCYRTESRVKTKCQGFRSSPRGIFGTFTGCVHSLIRPV